MGIADDIIKEPLGGANNDYDRSAKLSKRKVFRYPGGI